jgi:hypothetical protein
MKKSLLRHLTRPIRSPIGTRHRCFRNGSKPDTCRSGPLNHDQNRLFRSVRRHSSEIMFGVLVVILCGDGVAVLGFSTGERQIPLIVSLRIGRARRFGAGTRHPTLCAATDRWPGPAVIHVALLAIFHSYPSSSGWNLTLGALV